MRIKKYTSDLRAEDWQRIEPLIPVRRRSKWPLEQVVNGILYVLKNGCGWRDLPGEFPCWNTVHYYFAKWGKKGVWENINACLVVDYREKNPADEKKNAEPTTLILDSQSVKNSATATAQVGFDGGKLIKGRKRFVLIDTSGATVATCVLPANVHDGQTAVAWWAKLAHHPLLSQVKRIFIDGGFRGEFVRKMAKLYQIEVKVPQEVVRQAGKFCVHATRWVVERSISWITNNRRLARCYERKVANEESFILLCNIRRIVKMC